MKQHVSEEILECFNLSEHKNADGSIDISLLLSKLLPTESTLERLSNKMKIPVENAALIQKKFIEIILSSPYKRAEEQRMANLFIPNYIPGLFYLGERKTSPDFLMEEKNYPFEEWIVYKIISDIESLFCFHHFKQELKVYGTICLISDTFNALFFKTNDQKQFVDIIMNQIYSDIFRRMIMYYIYNDVFFICHTHNLFNKKMELVGLHILNSTNHYNLHERILQSQYSSVIGINLKESLISTAPVSLDGTFDIKFDNQNNYSQLLEKLDKTVHNENLNRIDDYSLFETYVIKEKNIFLTWITDDFLSSMFEMKFIEELLNINQTIKIAIIPRYDAYSNDASYHDIIHFLSLPIYSNLKKFYEHGRFIVCRDGFDVSTFDGTRLSEEATTLLERSNFVLIEGARAFEMAQGIKKNTFFTGLVVCKGYSESITGFYMDEFASIFLFQPIGKKSFYGFKNRHLNQLTYKGRNVGFADITVRDYYKNRNINDI